MNEVSENLKPFSGMWSIVLSLIKVTDCNTKMKVTMGIFLLIIPKLTYDQKICED